MARPQKVLRPTAEIGSAGLKQWSGFVDEEYLRVLKGQRGVQTYLEMRDNDPIVGSILLAIRMLMLSVTWTAEPEDPDNPDDVEAAEFLETIRDDMSHSWEDFISEVLSMLVFGWSYHEKVFKIRRGPDVSPRSKYNDGKIGWRKLPIRAQETLGHWEFDGEGGIAGLWQEDGNSEVFIPIEKALLFRTQTHKNNPEGRSVLRNGYRPYYFRKRIEEIEAIGVERDLAGLPVAWVPPAILNAKTGNELQIANKFKQMVRDVRRDEQEGIIMPLSYDENGNKVFDLELLSTGGQRQFNTVEIKQGYTKDIAISVLADFVLLGHEKVGSFALADTKTDFFTASLTGYLSSIEAVINRHGAEQLLRMNGFAGKAGWSHSGIETKGLDTVAEYVSKLSQVGAILPDQELENALREFAHLPEREDISDEDYGWRRANEQMDHQMEQDEANGGNGNSGSDSSE